MPLVNHEMPLMLWSGEEKIVGGVATLKQAGYLALGGGLAALLVLQGMDFWPLLLLAPLPVLAAAAMGFITVRSTGLGLDQHLFRLAVFRGREKRFPYSRRGCAPAGEPVRAQKPGVQDILGFEDIQNGVVRLPGNRWRLVCEVRGRVNFHLLSEEEQVRADARFQRFVLSLSFPVQIAVQSRYLDISEQVSRVREAVASAPEALRRYGEEHARHLERIMASRHVLVQRVFLVVPCDVPDPGEAQAELVRRAEVLRAALGEDLELSILDTKEALEVLYAAYNRERALTAPGWQVAEYGFLEPVVRGVMLSDVRAALEEEKERSRG